MLNRNSSRTTSTSLSTSHEYSKAGEEDLGGFLATIKPCRVRRPSVERACRPSLAEQDHDGQNQLSGYPILLEAVSSSTDMPKKGGESTHSSSKETSPGTVPRAIPWSEDRPNEMTYARRIALRLMKHKWYFPHALDIGGIDHRYDYSEDNDKTEPDLAKAWEYWEHVILPRHYYNRSMHRKKKHIHWWTRVLHRFQKGSQSLERASPGESYRPTKLYSPLFTPAGQLGDFGVGFGLFFSMQKALIFLTLLAGIINIPNIVFYASDSYSDGQEGIPSVLKGTAICTDARWVPCPDCSSSDFADALDRIATGVQSVTNETMTFALRNFCNGATIKPAMVNYGTMLFILMGILVLVVYQRRMESQFEEDESTAKDFSILIKNPPEDANDPEEWKLFFEQFEDAHVSCCTVAVDNDILVRSLVERRELMSRLELRREANADMGDVALARIAAQIERDRNLLQWLWSFVLPGIPELLARERVLTFRIQGLAQHSYAVRNVFLSFETEEAKHNVLEAMIVPANDVRKNDSRRLMDPERLMFRGTTVLRVEDPPEPSSLRWQDLNASFRSRILQVLFTTSVSAALICVIAVVVKTVDSKTALSGAYVIAGANAAFPAVAKALTKLESHVADCDKQTSLYLKIAAFRWVNTVVVVSAITPFTHSLSKGHLIYSVAKIFLAELVLTTSIRILDPVGHLKRHVLAPRAKNQDMMNTYMKGQEVELAELYTDFTKVVFLAFWYCAIFPSAFFICSLTLAIKYFADRFGIMRSWKRAPQVGSHISRFSRQYFLSLAFCALAIVSGYFFAGFPFDNLCTTNQSVPSALRGKWTVSSLEIPSGSGGQVVTVDSEDESYQYCLQNLLRTPGRRFPPIPQQQTEGGEWMTKDQELVATIYGWTGVAVVASAVFLLLFNWTGRVSKIVSHYYETKRVDQGVTFSQVNTDVYVPQVQSSMFPHPLIACNTEGIDEHLFGWMDPDRLHAHYDLSQDVAFLCSEIGHDNNIFSQLMHWPYEPECEEAVEEEEDLDSFSFC